MGLVTGTDLGIKIVPDGIPRPKSKPALALSSAFTKVTGRQAAFVTRVPASDASRWRALGIPSVCFGPQPELVSGVDDYVNETNFVDCIEVYRLACLELLAQA